MSNKFQIKRTSVSGRTPNTSDPVSSSYIDAGELAINLPDGKLFSSNGSALFEIGANLSNLTVHGPVVISGNLTVNGTSTTVSTRNLSLTDNMIYLNEPMSATITNAVGNGSVVIYTATNVYESGMVVTVSGMNPSSFNLASWTTITAANSTTFSVASAVTDSFVSGGTASAKAGANPDLGFAGGYYDSSYRHAGFFRDATDAIFKVFDQYTPEPNGAFVDTSNTSFRIADFQANTVYGQELSISNTATITGFLKAAGNTLFANSTLIKINANDILTFNDGTTQNTAFRVYDSSGTRLA